MSWWAIAVPPNSWSACTRPTEGACAISMNDVSIAVLGSGFVADFYMQGLADVKGARVIANYSRNKTRAKDFAKRWSIPEPGTDIAKRIARTDIDVYIVALPNEAPLPVSLDLYSPAKTHVRTHTPALTRTNTTPLPPP